MKRSLTAILALALAGCGTFGHVDYSVTHSDKGGCDLRVKDGKEFTARNIGFNGADCSMQIFEGESKAFAGQAIGAKVMTILPVTGLDSLVPPPDQIIRVK